MDGRLTARLVGEIDEDSVLYSDRQLVIWSLVMYALGMFTGLGIMTAVSTRSRPLAKAPVDTPGGFDSEQMNP